MTQEQDKTEGMQWKALLERDEDFLKALVKEVVQQVLEAEMEEALGASKSERTASRVGYRSGYYSRTLMTRVGKLGATGTARSARAVFDTAVRSLPAQRESAFQHAGPDVRARSVHA